MKCHVQSLRIKFVFITTVVDMLKSLYGYYFAPSVLTKCDLYTKLSMYFG